MTRMQAIQTLKDSPQLHISYSQIFTYLACGLKYKFQYVTNRPFERISANLFFGSAIHSALERYYRTLKEKGTPETLKNVKELFCDCINLELDKNDLPVLFKREAPDRDSLIQMGVSMLEAFHDSIDLNGYEVVDVELPLSATLYTDVGEPTDFKLVGVIDLLLMDRIRNCWWWTTRPLQKPRAKARSMMISSSHHTPTFLPQTGTHFPLRR